MGGDTFSIWMPVTKAEGSRGKRRPWDGIIRSPPPERAGGGEWIYSPAEERPLFPTLSLSSCRVAGKEALTWKQEKNSFNKVPLVFFPLLIY